MTLDRAEFADLMASFPTGVTVVTAVDAEGQPRGTTVNAFSSVSADPPLCLICLDRGSNTLPAVLHARSFVVNFLRAGEERLSRRFASKSEDKFDDVGWHRAPQTGQPLLHDQAAHAECRVWRSVEAGDHWVIIGLIEGGRVNREVAPLMYYRRRYGVWPEAHQPAEAGASWSSTGA